MAQLFFTKKTLTHTLPDQWNHRSLFHNDRLKKWSGCFSLRSKTACLAEWSRSRKADGSKCCHADICCFVLLSLDWPRRNNSCLCASQSLYQTADAEWILWRSANQRALHTQCATPHTARAQVWHIRAHSHINKHSRTFLCYTTRKIISLNFCLSYLQVSATWLHQSEDQPREVAGDSHPGCEYKVTQ